MLLIRPYSCYYRYREIMISPSSGLNMEEEKKQEIVERDQDLEDQLPAAAGKDLQK